MTAQRNIVILGSTGSIGVNTLDVIGRHPSRFSVLALTAHRQIDRLHEQIIAYKPRYAVVVDEQAAGQLAQRLRDPADAAGRRHARQLVQLLLHALQDPLAGGILFDLINVNVSS
ncbi:MAG: hypothetical protein EBT83_04780 [Betaproteobacteria bacterium]|nr:hypothetical protein [Betaproteobacteria bacterium]